MRSICILAEASFNTRQAKTAIGVIRYGNWRVSSVIDSQLQGQNAAKILGLQGNIPIVADIYAALEHSPDALLIGIAPAGGKLPVEWLEIIRIAIVNGLDIISGLHEFLADNAELRGLAAQHSVKLWDIRDPSLYSASAQHFITRLLPRPSSSRVITMVGSDCNVGKMTVALELRKSAQRQGFKASFVATGQTGIMLQSQNLDSGLISAAGIPLDRVIGDFMAGSIEAAIHEQLSDYIFVEGQGSLLHPAYSAVTLALIHGSSPDSLVLCHKAGLHHIQGDYDIAIPSWTRLISIYEEAASWVRLPEQLPAKVQALALNTFGLSEAEAQECITAAESETGLPCVDPVRYSADKIFAAIK